MNRIQKRFVQLSEKKQPGLVTFITASDPNFMTCQRILNDLPAHGADFIELGMPFSDPMADGPIIQAASQRALANEGGLKNTLKLAKSFRAQDDETPLILMGYYNPIYRYGADRFISEAVASGVDGLIIVDLPPEEDFEIKPQAESAGIEIIRLVTPTTSDERLPHVLAGAGGFLYCVSITGVTGTAKPDSKTIAGQLNKLREQTDLPLAVGFGIKTPEDARRMGEHADAVVVGSEIVRQIQDAANDTEAHQRVMSTVRALSDSLKAARS